MPRVTFGFAFDERYRMNEQVPQKSVSNLGRWAVACGTITVGLPVLWALLVSGSSGNTSLASGWVGVLPVILLVPIGSIATLVLTIATVVQSRNRSQENSSADEA